MSAGRRRGETRRTRHDTLAKAHELSPRDAEIVKELLDDEHLAQAARLFLAELLRASSAKIGLDTWKPGDTHLARFGRDALEDLAHGLVRSVVKPAQIKLLLESLNLKRCELVHKKVYRPTEFTSDMQKEMDRLDVECELLCELLVTPKKR